MSNAGLMYIMVTHFKKHWDNVTYSSYPPRMFKWGLTEEKLHDNTPTIFVKVNEYNRKVERVWRGCIRNIRKNEKDGKYYFDVKIISTVEDTEPYQDLEDGWYLSKPEPQSDETKILRPPFFDMLLTTKDWKEFERLTIYLLKLLGVNRIHQFHPEQQSGRSDGFFRLENLAVIYDCTLEDDFEERKRVQIDNYCHQLDSGYIEVDPRTSIDVRSSNKQVWIITRGHDRVVRQKNEVLVREVSIRRLIEIYMYRLQSLSTESDLEKKLEECQSVRG